MMGADAIRCSPKELIISDYAVHRILIHSTQSGGQKPNIEELELRTTPGVSVNMSSYSASSSSDFAYYTADRAIDGNLSTYWIADGYPPQWLQISGVPVKVVEISMKVDSRFSAPNSFTLQGSQDGLEFYDIAHFSGFGSWFSNETKIFTI